MNIVDKIIDYESGNLSRKGTLELFSQLIKTGQAWSLQGHYGRVAKAYIELGLIDRQGKILRPQ